MACAYLLLYFVVGRRYKKLDDSIRVKQAKGQKRSMGGRRLWSYIAWHDWGLRKWLEYHGMEFRVIRADADNETEMSWWVPKSPKEGKKNLVLIHGFGNDASWQWWPQIQHLSPYFNVYAPDLVFFGQSRSKSTHRSETFQAQCVYSCMESLRLCRSKVFLCGISYGGLVAYRVAQHYPESVDKVVIVCSGILMEPHHLLQVFGTDETSHIVDIFLPRAHDKLRDLVNFTWYKPPRFLPSFVLQDFINTFYNDQRKEKIGLLHHLTPSTGEKLSFPPLSQETLLIWGDKDRVFPLELGHKLKRHLGAMGKLEIIKDAGHVVQLEKPNEFNKLIKLFLL